jgi:transposase
LTPQKPAKRAIQQNQSEVKQWLEAEYPAIRKLAQVENAEILWGGECGFRSDHQTGTTYGRRGKTPVVPRQGNRFSCNMISAVSNFGSLYFRVFVGKFTSEVFVDYLRRLARQIGQNGKKAFLIVDNHRAHKSKAVKKWLAKHQKEIRVFYLPSYSPEFNPDEYLNNDVKSNAVGRVHAANRNELENNVRSFLRSTQKHPNIVKAFFNASFVQYAKSQTI